MKLRGSLRAFAMLFLWASVSQACTSDPQATFSYDHDDNLVHIAGETSSLPESAIQEFAEGPVAMLLHDHEGPAESPLARDLVAASAPGLFEEMTFEMSPEDKEWVVASLYALEASIAGFVAEANLTAEMALEGLEDR
jgi:hypothetical protein